jgi:tripartite-type tricarboxylate transporter receptor subunit TctC
MMAGIELTAVHFKGGGPAAIDTMGGHSHISLASLIQNLPHIRSGKLKALGTGGAKRSLILPDVPTIAEAGVPGYEANNWWGIFLPAGTPPSIVDRLNKECSAILTSAEIQKLFLTQGAEADYLGPEKFGKFIAAETAKFTPVIKQLGLTAQ